MHRRLEGNARKRARPPARQEEQPPADWPVEAREFNEGMPRYRCEPEDKLPRRRIRQKGKTGLTARAGTFGAGWTLCQSGPAGSFCCGALRAPAACCSCAFFILSATVQAWLATLPDLATLAVIFWKASSGTLHQSLFLVR